MKSDSEPNFDKPSENLFCNQDIEIEEKTLDLLVDCEKEFGKSKGLHRKVETTTRYENKLTLKKFTVRTKIITDFATGKTVRADKTRSCYFHLLPEGFLILQTNKP